ncbi:MAG: tetratricopeptide repeat protein, partial [Rubrobacteraceae bacterium]|nr:tetratricopeptide repeat protein [Rubrobacteraceae bacterium]
MSRVILRVSAGILVGVLFVLAILIRLSDHYISEEQRLVAAGDHRGAEQSIRKAALLDPFSPEPMELQAYLEQSRGDNQAAAQALREAIARDPNNFVPYLLLGNLQASRLNDLRDAERSYREALRLNPHATVASNALAQVLLRENRLKAAGRIYQRLADDHKITIEGLYDLGRIYVRTGKPEKGLRYIRQARFRLKKMMRGTSGADRARLE